MRKIKMQTRLIFSSILVLIYTATNGKNPAPSTSETFQQAMLRIKHLDSIQTNLLNKTDYIIKILNTTDQKLNNINDEVDKSMISELWFGFVSDRFTNALNSMLGIGDKASTPLWAAGLLSLLLLVIKLLSFLISKNKPESKFAKVLGTTFIWVVSLYLIILTGSMFMLAINAPDSDVARFKELNTASEELVKEMQVTSSSINGLTKDLPSFVKQINDIKITLAESQGPAPHTGDSVQLDNTIEYDFEQIIDLTKMIQEDIKNINNKLNIQEDLKRVEGNQHGFLWTSLVGVAALCILIYTAVNVSKLFQV